MTSLFEQKPLRLAKSWISGLALRARGTIFPRQNDPCCLLAVIMDQVNGFGIKRLVDLFSKGKGEKSRYDNKGKDSAEC
jgi:hypothetical protein